MRQGLFSTLSKSILSKSMAPALALAVGLALSSPAAVLAREHDRGGGHSYSGGRSYGGGSGFREGNRGWGGGRDYDRGRRDRDDRGRYYGGGWRGYYGAPLYGGYAYGPDYCGSGGYYDNWGNWHPYAGCSTPWGY